MVGRKRHFSFRLLMPRVLFMICFFVLTEFAARGYYAMRGIPFWETSLESLDPIYCGTHPYLPAVFRKNSRLKRQDLFINNIGFRGPDISMPKKNGSLRIAVLGGSTIWGCGISDEESCPRILEAKLRKEFPQKETEVINAAVPGYNSMEDLINLITKVLPLKPDIVVVYQGYNDMKAIARATTFEPDYSDWRNRQDPHRTLKRTLTNYSRFLYGLDRLAKKIASLWVKDVNTSQRVFEDHGQLASFRRNIFNIVAICKAHNIIPIISTNNLALDSDFIYVPSSINIKPSEYKVILKAYNRQIRDVAAEQDAVLVDAEKALPDDKSIHSDICHFTPYGNERLAEIFAKKIADIIRRTPADF